MNTVSDDYLMHSCHCYFVLSGDPKIPIYYYVERIRDGKSFATRTVQARQRGRTIFTVICSFHRPEPAWLEHAAVMPYAPPPESLPTDSELMDQLYKEGKLDEQHWKIGKLDSQNDSIEWRRVVGGLRRSPINTDGRPPTESAKLGWVRAKGPISTKGMKAHIMALSYFSDSWFIGTAVGVHGLGEIPKGGMIVSLDHTVYFHREFRADEWMLFEMRSPGMLYI